MKEGKKKSGFATAALVLGIIGLCTSFIPIFNNVSFILALIGVLFAIVALVQKASRKMAIVAIIVCILTCVYTIKAQEATVKSINDAVDNVEKELNGDSTEDILKNSCDVTFGQFETTSSDFRIMSTKLSVTVKNKSSETKSFSIKVEAVNSDGSRIETDTVYIDSLNAGQTQEASCFQFVSSDKVESLKNATFKVVEISMY